MWGGFILALLLTAILVLVVIGLFTGYNLPSSHDSETVFSRSDLFSNLINYP